MTNEQFLKVSEMGAYAVRQGFSVRWSDGVLILRLPDLKIDKKEDSK